MSYLLIIAALIIVTLVAIYMSNKDDYALIGLILKFYYHEVENLVINGKPITIQYKTNNITPKTISSYNSIYEHILIINENVIATVWEIETLWVKKRVLLFNDAFKKDEVISILRANKKEYFKQWNENYKAREGKKQSII